MTSDSHVSIVFARVRILAGNNEYMKISEEIKMTKRWRDIKLRHAIFYK